MPWVQVNLLGQGEGEKMQIKSIKIENFKGLRNFECQLDGRDASIFGDNATGKTTIVDGVDWLLFDKDSSGSAQFNVKTLDANNVAIPMLDHTVEAVFDIGGNDCTLRKTYREKYTKRRGSAESEFTGHETEYQINGVPKSLGEYKKFIESIAPESLFRLLTSPTYFNEGLKWDQRRQMLLDVCGTVTDAEVIASSPELAPLLEVMDQHNLEDLKKIKGAERKKINDELTSIPDRVDEATKAKPEISGNPEQLMIKAKRIASEISQLNTEVAGLENGGVAVKLRNQIAEIDGQIIKARNAHNAGAVDVSAEQKQIDGLQLKKSTASNAKVVAATQLPELEKQELGLVEANKTIRAEYEAKRRSAFVPGGSCPTCGQDYPENLVAVQEADFNRERATSLEKIAASGQENAAKVKELRAKIVAAKEAVATNTTIANDLAAQIETLQSAIAKKQERPNFESLPEYAELQAKKTEIETSLSDLQKAQAGAVAEVQAKIDAKQAELADVNKQITAIDQAANQDRRIEELKQREKELSRQFEQAEKVLHLIELFERRQAEFLDQTINKHFPTVRFRLTDYQINGGSKPTCICTVNGVPYPDLNNAGKIQAGMEIISVLSAHHNFRPCVFVDNRESIVSLPDMDCQIISLIVSAGDPSLRVELQ